MFLLFTAHQILSLTGISFERKSIIVSIHRCFFTSKLVNSDFAGFRGANRGSVARQPASHQTQRQAMPDIPRRPERELRGSVPVLRPFPGHMSGRYRNVGHSEQTIL